jgi:hypothetical protein
MVSDGCRLTIIESDEMKRAIPLGNPEFEIARNAFNLAVQHGIDPERVRREQREAEQRRREAEEFERAMQRKLSACPGFLATDAPSGPASRGRVVVAPGLAQQAMEWLRRRFQVSESLELDSAADGLVFEIIPRAARSGGRRVQRSFIRNVQFELPL